MCDEMPIATICKEDVLTARHRAAVTVPVVDHDIRIVIVDGTAAWRHVDVDGESESVTDSESTGAVRLTTTSIQSILQGCHV
jgi:hypothetical protein